MTSTKPKSRMPLIGNVIQYIPNQELIMRRTLNLDEDAFLADHLFVNARGVKAPSQCLPVVPFTVSLEMMAEVAACLAPGCGLLGFENISAQEWIQLDEPTLVLNMVAKVQPSMFADTSIVLVQLFKNGQSKPAIQGKVLLGHQYQLNLSFTFSELNNSYDSPFTPQQIYQDGYLFHGPQFQVVGSRPKFGDLGVTGDLLVKDKAEMFQSNPNPELLTDPLLMDGVGQFIGLWAMERDWYVFPIGVDKIEFYQQTPSAGTLAPIRGEITQTNVRFLSSNLEVQDGAGSVWFRVKGWKKWIFRWDKKSVQFRRKPTHFCSSQKVPLKGAAENGLVRLMAKKDFVDLDVSIMARNYLNQKEMEYFDSLLPQLKEAERWLMEIIVAKDVVREWLALTMGTSDMRHPASFEMIKQEGTYQVIGLPEEVPPITVACTDKEALAILYKKNLPFVVKSIGTDSIESMKEILTDREEALLDPFPKDEKDMWTLRIRCAKEVVNKFFKNSGLISNQLLDAAKIEPSGEVEIFSDSEGLRHRIDTFQIGEFVFGYLMAGLAHHEGNEIPQNHFQTVNGTI